MPEIIAHAPDGAELHFPDGTPDTVVQGAVRQHLNVSPLQSGGYASKLAASFKPSANPIPSAESPNPTNSPGVPGGRNDTIDMLRNILPPAAGAAAGAVATPYTGGLGTASASIAGYGLTDTLLKALKTNGISPKDLPEEFVDSLGSAAVNEAGGRILGGAWKGLKAYTSADQPEILKFLPTASQALKAEGKMPTVSSILKYVEDHFAPGTKATAQEASAAAGASVGTQQAAKIAGRSPTTVSNPNDMINGINSELGPEVTPVGGMNKYQPYANNPAEMDKLISDPNRLQDALTKSQLSGQGINARQDIAGYNLMRIQQAATEVQPDGGIRIDPAKIQSMFNDPTMASSNKILYNSQTQSNIQQFYKNVAATQDKAQGFGGFGKLRLAAEGISVAGGLMHALITGSPTSLEVSLAPVAVEIGLSGLAKTLASPKTARLMLSLANNEALGVSDQFAARALVKTLSGTAGFIVNSDGTKIPVQFGKDGSLNPVQPAPPVPLSQAQN